MRWKSILCGAVLTGLCWMGVSAAATLRNKPASKTKTEAMWDLFDAYGTETVTTTAANPGLATASAYATVTVVFSDATGAAQDVVTLPDGSTTGEVHQFILAADNETAGTVIAPTNVVMTGGAGTSTLLETVGDTVTFTWSGTNWYLTGNIGGTVQ